MSMSKILILSCGGLGYAAVVRELKEEKHYIVGVDCREEHHGKYLSDKFYRVPPYRDRGYVDKIKEIVEREGIDYIMGGHTMELIILQEAGFKNVLASPPESLRVIIDKYKTYRMFPQFSPSFSRVTTSEELYENAERMGFPDKKLCVKPCVSSGARGFRILVDDYDKTTWTFNRKKDPHITIDELAKLDFPPLLLMEFIEGPVWHVDILAYKGEIKKAVTSYRLEERFGFGFSLECEDKPEYVDMAREIVKRLKLCYNCFIQVINGKLIEVGGRMQGSVGIGLDLAKGAVELAQGREPNKNVSKVRMIRYWKEIFVEEDRVFER